MSNKDTSKEAYPNKKSKLDLFQKEEMLLFSYELLKSNKKFDLFDINSFRYEFFEEKGALKQSKNSNKPKMKINNRTISIIDDDNNSSLKTLNIEVPLVQRLSKEDFKKNFLKNYNDSFAFFCGINKEQYENIYIKNKYMPIIDKFGDIKINIKNIIKVLKEYKNDKKIIKSQEKQRIKKTFIMNKRNRDNTNDFKYPFRIKLLNDLNKTKTAIEKTNNEINNNISHINIINNNINNINNIQRNNIGFNLKDKGRGLSIRIPKNINNINNILNKNTNNILGQKTFPNLKIPNNTFSYQLGNVMNKNYIPNINNINPATIGSVLSNSRQQPSSSDIFNFSNRDISKYINLGINNANIIPTISPNIPLLTPLISPYPLSPYHNLFSAHFSNNILQEGANFNNIINPNSFIFPPNSPAMINININNSINLNNNIVNGNIFNNNNNSQNNSIKNNNSSSNNS